MKKTVMGLIAGLFLVGMTASANAFVVTPTTMAAYTAAYGALVAGPVVTQNYTIFSGGATLGTITEQVYTNSIGTLFVYDFSRNTTSQAGLDAIGTLGTFAYGNLPVGVYSLSEDAGSTPSTWSYLAGNLQVTYDQGVLLGGETQRLLVQSNLPYVTQGYFSLQGGATTGTYNGYVPTATPEPATVMLLSTGLLGLFGFRRKSA